MATPAIIRSKERGTPQKATEGLDVPKTKWKIDTRFVAPALLSVILLIGHSLYSMLEDWRKTFVCILVSIFTELVLGKLITKKFPHWASAYVSGISAGILVRSTEWWPYLIAPMIAITSKYVLRVNGRHLWNPTNLAVAGLVLTAHETVSTLGIQWGNDLLPMLIIWIAGGIIVWRLGRIHISLTYVASFFFYALVRALITHGDMPLINAFKSEISPITGPMYQLFIFFMITDPKTTTKTKWGQMLVAFLVASMECVLRLAATLQIMPLNLLHISTHAAYFALFTMGPTANLLEIFQARKKTPMSGTPSLTPATP
jgi:enediyne biosynthesis protein E5